MVEIEKKSIHDKAPFHNNLAAVLQEGRDLIDEEQYFSFVKSSKKSGCHISQRMFSHPNTTMKLQFLCKARMFSCYKFIFLTYLCCVCFLVFNVIYLFVILFFIFIFQK